MASISSTQRMQDAFDAERSQSRSNNERDLEKAKEEYERELVSTKKSYNEQLIKDRKEANEDVRKLKEDLYDRKGKKFSNESRDFQSERADLQNYREKIESETKDKVAKTQSFASDQMKSADERTQDKVGEALALQKRSNAQEVKDLEQQLESYKNREFDPEHQRALTREETINKMEGEQIHERNRIMDSYERQINNLKQKQGELEDSYDRHLTEMGAQATANTEVQLRNQKKEFIRKHADQVDDSARVEKDYNTHLKQAEDSFNRSSDRLIHKNEEDTFQALGQKDQAYREYLTANDKKVRYDMGKKDAELQVLKTTDDRMKASPALVEKIETESEMRNFQKLQEAESVHNKNLASTRDRDLKERSELQDGYRKKYMDFTREHQRTNDVQQHQTLNAYQSLEERSQREKADMKKSQSDLAVRTSLKHSDQLNLQQQKAQEQMDVQRDSFNEEKSQLIGETDQKARSQDHEWFTKLNTTQRDFQNKLADQQDEHDRQTELLRFEYYKRFRDQDRTSARVLDERVKAYEHQIKQQELAFKEKERFLTEHYEEELASMKRSNARLIQKKS